MSDQQQRTQWAVDMLRSFVGVWVAPGARALPPVKGAVEMVENNIRAIAPKGDDTARVGWAVFKRDHDRDYDRERPSGYVHTLIGAVFENPAQATNAQQACYSKHPEGTYIVCEIREIP